MFCGNFILVRVSCLHDYAYNIPISIQSLRVCVCVQSIVHSEAECVCVCVTVSDLTKISEKKAKEWRGAWRHLVKINCNLHSN